MYGKGVENMKRLQSRNLWRQRLLGGKAALLALLLLAGCAGPAKKDVPASAKTSPSSHASDKEGALSEKAPAKAERPPRKQQNADFDAQGRQEQLMAAQQKNSDVRGWLYIPGTEIDYPVFQNNGDGYLSMDINKNFSEFGSVTLDYECILDERAPSSLCQNTIIYGRNLGSDWQEQKALDEKRSKMNPMELMMDIDRQAKEEEAEELARLDAAKEEELYQRWLKACETIPNFEYYNDFRLYARRQLSKESDFHTKDDPDSPMFGQLVKFTDKKFAQQTPYLYLMNKNSVMTFEVFSVAYTEPTPTVGYVYVKYPPLAFQLLLTDFAERSLYDYHIDVTNEDKILTLSTDTYRYESGWHCRSSDREKLVIMARLMDPDEPRYATADLEENPSPKAPSIPIDLR